MCYRTRRGVALTVQTFDIQSNREFSNALFIVVVAPSPLSPYTHLVQSPHHLITSSPRHPSPHHPSPHHPVTSSPSHPLPHHPSPHHPSPHHPVTSSTQSSITLSHHLITQSSLTSSPMYNHMPCCAEGLALKCLSLCNK